MQGLMQDVGLTLQLVRERAAALWSDKHIATRRTEDTMVSSYAQMDERVHRLAAALADLGVQPGDRVATFGWNSQRHLELYLAVPCMGAVLHTLNIRLHHDQVAWIAHHAQDVVVFVDASTAKAWEQVGDLPSVRQVVVCDDVSPSGRGEPAIDGAVDYEALLDGAEADFAWPRLDEDQAAAMCYTSGTTGDPKGVVYSHRSSTLHAMASLFADSLAVRERDVVLPIVPQFHANAWGVPYAALMAGADLAMPGRFMDPESVATLVSERGVTLSAAVPTVWFGMLQAITEGTIPAEKLASLERLVIGGSAVPEALMRGFDDLGITVVHAWGMTETSPLGTVATVRSDVAQDDVLATRLTQGLPAPTLSQRVVADDGSLAPWDDETMGEYQVSGPWIADAYYEPQAPDGRGGLDRFDTDDAGRRWLKTGDVAVIRRDGYVRLVDRTKDLVKSGGEWISTVHLENLLQAHPGIAEAAVIAVAHPKWDERPLACVVRTDESLDADAVRDYLGEHVAKWQVPDDVVFVDEVPKTSVGKFDKKVLRREFADHALTDRG